MRSITTRRALTSVHVADFFFFISECAKLIVQRSNVRHQPRRFMITRRRRLHAMLDGAISMFEGNFPTLSRIVERDRRRRKRMRVERSARPSAGPLQHRLTLRMTNIVNDLEEFFVTMRPADIFRRTRARAGQATRVRAPIGWNKFLEFQHMFPVIAEVVPVSHWIRAVRQESCDRNLPAGETPPLIRHLVVRDADSPGPTRFRLDDDEFVEMVVLPAHRVLNGNVKIPKRVTLRHLNTPPHQWISIGKDNQELVDMFRLCDSLQFWNLGHRICPSPRCLTFAMNRGAHDLRAPSVPSRVRRLAQVGLDRPVELTACVCDIRRGESLE